MWVTDLGRLATTILFALALWRTVGAQEPQPGALPSAASPATDYLLPSTTLPYVQAAYGDEAYSPHFSLTQGLEFTLRSGAVFPLGHGTLERNMDAGWKLEGSLVQPWWEHPLGWTGFVEIGAGLTFWSGDDGRISTSGTFRSSPTEEPLFLEDFQRTRAERIVNRYGLAAIGATWYPAGLNPEGESRWRITTRLGARLGSARGQFDRDPSPALRDAVDEAINAGADPQEFEVDSDVNHSDVSVGLFGSLAVGATYHDVWLGGWHLGDVKLQFEVELGHDWIDFGDFNKSDSGLGSVGALFTLGLLH
jgi:hypothetical protein